MYLYLSWTYCKVLVLMLVLDVVSVLNPQILTNNYQHILSRRKSNAYIWCFSDTMFDKLLDFLHNAVTGHHFQESLYPFQNMYLKTKNADSMFLLAYPMAYTRQKPLCPSLGLWPPYMAPPLMDISRFLLTTNFWSWNLSWMWNLFWNWIKKPTWTFFIFPKFTFSFILTKFLTSRWSLYIVMISNRMSFITSIIFKTGI